MLGDSAYAQFDAIPDLLDACKTDADCAEEEECGIYFMTNEAMADEDLWAQTSGFCVFEAMGSPCGTEGIMD